MNIAYFFYGRKPSSFRTFYADISIEIVLDRERPRPDGTPTSITCHSLLRINRRCASPVDRDVCPTADAGQMLRGHLERAKHSGGKTSVLSGVKR